MALTVLFFAAAGIFHDTELRETEWFFPVLCAAMAAVVGLVFLLDGGFTPLGISLYLVKILLSGLCPVAYAQLRRRRETAGENPVLPRREKRSPDPGPQLRKVARVFDGLNRELADPVRPTDENEVAGVYDAAADQVCRLCVRNQLCWETEGEQTYNWLCQAARPMLQRGLALREDFPPEFSDQCRHMEGFVTAVNQALDDSVYRRQLRNRLREGRQILANQYLFLSRFLTNLAEPGKENRREPLFQPELAVGSAMPPGHGVSGDRGASFRDKQGNLFVLLCDGMGTGAEAAAESGKAVRTLTGLLEAGVAPDTAMEILNDFYVLQENTSFATVDLLQLSLITGEGVLYKWGAAPSYLKEGDRVRQIGTVTAPPGLTADPGHAAQQFRLSLTHGETLVLVSDGAYGEETERRIGGFRSGTAKDLSTYLAAGAGEARDDLTNLVLRLKPVA